MSSELALRYVTVGAFSENSYVVGCVESGHGVLIDPGGEVPELLRIAAEMGLEINDIWLTHAHLDHVLGLHEAVERTGAPIWLHPEDRFLYEAAPQQGQAFGFPIEALPEPDESFESGQKLQLGGHALEVLHVPGHSPGHVAFWFPGSRLLISGDVLFAGSIGRTDLPGGNLEQLMKSIRGEVLTLPDDVRLLTGHGPETTVGLERRSNPFLIPDYGGHLA